MSITLEDVIALEELELKLRAILPEQYQDSYDEVLPISMGSAGLKYDLDGRVAWNEMWATFCDLAMAGGPPHRGSLLEPASPEAVAASTRNYNQVVEEISRGISMVTSLPVPSSLQRVPGWIGISCQSTGMAGWLVRAIVMENVLARHDAETLFLPAGPDFRLAKEIKNVITVTAKTCHYWTDHMPPDQQESLDRMFASPAFDSELLEPGSIVDVQNNPDAYRNQLRETAREITERTGRTCFPNRYVGWIGVEYPDDRTAIWLMRAMVVENILSRREGSVLFLPVSPCFANEGRNARLLRTLERANRLHILMNPNRD